MSHYRDAIAELTDAEPALVEAWMRLQYGTLDGLSPERFEAEVLAGAALVAMAPDESRRLAQSYGLPLGEGR